MVIRILVFTLLVIAFCCSLWLFGACISVMIAKHLGGNDIVISIIVGVVIGFSLFNKAINLAASISDRVHDKYTRITRG